MAPFAQRTRPDHWAVGNERYAFELALDGPGGPTIAGIDLAPHRGAAGIHWGATAAVLAPVLMAGGDHATSGGVELVFRGVEVAGSPGEVRLRYSVPGGLEVCHHLQPARAQAAWHSWTTLHNPTTQPISGVRRFDALNLRLRVGAAEPQVEYILGWLDGPRADAPGHHAVPFPYPSWIPRLLYGDGAPPPQAPAGGWTAPVLRVVRERLTRLPLRSGKRSTYDNYPWAAVLDPQAGGGFYAGLEWSGTWQLDLAHDPAAREVAIAACTAGNTHTLRPGETLTSPFAFFGLFAGDWDDASVACNQYVADEILPPPPVGFPLLSFNYGCPDKRSFGGDAGHAEAAVKAKVDAAADAGFENFMIDAMWWAASPLEGDFSIGLGDLMDNRTKFPHGLRGLSDYVHSKGMRFGLWFEFERVDLRTANLGRFPWSPAWLVHQKGYPYRSWCQHVYLLCLGVRAAAEWALESISWAIREYGVDWMKIDSNEWAVCDDPTHDHGREDGEWAQVQGLYHVLRGLRERFPHLVIENCAGGSQRGDMGMARYCDYLAHHDTNAPSAILRQYSHGSGCIYPPYYGKNYLPAYPLVQPGPAGQDRLEWRALSRLMGLFEGGWDLSGEDLAGLKSLLAEYKGIRPVLRGSRYVLVGPTALVERENREAGEWEAYEFVSPDGALAGVFFFRCLSPLDKCHVLLRGLEPGGRYRVRSHRGGEAGEIAGAELMTKGVTSRLPGVRMADLLVLQRV